MWREILTWGGIAVWLTSTAVGFGLWQEYEATPGAAPAASQVLAATEHPRVVVYLHPRCPCSRATLDELALVLEQHRDAEVEIVFVRPPGVEAGWELGELWDRASALSGVRIRVDMDGTEAKAAGAATSGTVIYSNEAGRSALSGRHHARPRRSRRQRRPHRPRSQPLRTLRRHRQNADLRLPAGGPRSIIAQLAHTEVIRG